jgi:hypothetical protein
VLLANQTSGDYWIRIQSYGDCVGGDNDGHGAAILHYNGYVGNDDYMPNTNVEDFSQEGIVSITSCCVFFYKEYTILQSNTYTVYI